MTSLFPKDLFPLGSSDLFDNYFGDSTEIDEAFNEMRRRYLTLLQMEGTPCKLLQLKTSGQRCAFWSEESKQCSRPLEPTSKCFNTGWVQGYEKPIDILVRFVSPGSTVKWYSEGQRVDRALRSWSAWTPLLKSQDVIVNSQTGERYFLSTVTTYPQWRKGLIAWQEFDTTLVTTEPVAFFGKADGLIL